MFKDLLKMVYKLFNTPITICNNSNKEQEQEQEQEGPTQSSVTYEVLGLHGIITYISKNEYKCKLIKSNGNTISNVVMGYNNAVNWLYKSAEYIREYD